VLLVFGQNWYLVDDKWTTSEDGSSSIVLSAADLIVESRGAGCGFTWIQIWGMQIYSCYNSRSDSEENFSVYLQDLELSLRSVDYGDTLS